MIEKAKAREYLIKARFYKFFAIVFAVAGFGMAAYLFNRETHGDVVGLLRNPVILLLVIVPFLPAVVLSFKARSAGRKLEEYLEETAQAEDGKPSPTEKK